MRWRRAVLTCAGTDSDGDSVPDLWELQYGLEPGRRRPTVAVDADGDGRTNAQECTDAHASARPLTRYLAEGATGAFFDTRVVLANPGATPSRLLFRFQTGPAEVVRHFIVRAGDRRAARSTCGLLAGLASANISTVIESDVQVVVDRTMRWDQATRGGAHAETSSPAPSLTWYLAEGATHGAFDLFYLLQNPSRRRSRRCASATCCRRARPIEPATSTSCRTPRHVYVDEQPGLAATDVSGRDQSLNGVPIIVERAMYSSAAGTFAAGHDSAGVTSPSLDWFFAEGATGAFFDTFVLLANPNASPANVTATYLLPSGQTVSRNYALPAEQPAHNQRAAEQDARLARRRSRSALASTTA